MASEDRLSDPTELSALRDRVRSLHERVTELGRHL